MKRLRYLLPITLLPTAITAIAQDATPSADEIVRKAEHASYYAGRDGRADVRMTIRDAGGTTRTREFTILRINAENGGQKFYVYFKEPADVRRMAYLVWKHGDKRDDDRWLWQPALNNLKRIAPGDKRTSFVGSDFLYEDVSGRDVQEDVHELLETQDGRYVIRSTPKNPDSVEFSSYKVWIDTKSFLPLKAEYLDKSERLYRRVEAATVAEIDGYPTVTTAVAADLTTGSVTTNLFSNVKYDIGLDENIFTERFLRRPPREVR